MILGRDHRSVVLGKAFERLPGEVEPIEVAVLAFQLRHDPHTLCVVIETAVIRHRGVERAFAGMAEWRVAEIVGQRQRLGQILVQPQLARDGARDLRHFQTVRQPCAVVIALVVDEDLRLVGQAAEGGGMQDAVAIPLEGRARGALRLGMHAPARRDGARGIDCRPAFTGF